jgi:prepilin-type N-terminal cleavage/methylation domain-containing protein
VSTLDGLSPRRRGGADPAARADDGADDRGISLVELLVAMMVGSILLAGVATVFIGTLRAVRTVNVKTASAADVRLGMESMSRTLRVAVQPAGTDAAVVSATSSSVSFYALLNRTGAAATAQPTPTLVEYAWNGTCVTEAQTPARTVTSPPATGPFYAWDTGRQSRCVFRTAVAPVFTYYGDGVTTTALDLTAGATRADIESVQVVLTAKDAANSDVSPVVSTARVTLRNVVYAAGGSA